MFTKARLITQLGNQAVHSHRSIQESDALTADRELFHVGYWLAHTKGSRARRGARQPCSAELSPRVGLVSTVVGGDVEGETRSSRSAVVIIPSQHAQNVELAQVPEPQR